MLSKLSTFEFKSVFDALDVGIVVLDSHGQIVAWNDWLVGVSRLSKDAALGKSLFELFPSLRDTRLSSAIDDSLQIGSSSVLTHSLNKLLPLFGADGHLLLHNIVVRPLASSNSPCCLLQISDVTVAVTRERLLRDRQNARYHAIVDSAPEAIITTGLDRTVHWINGATERVFGYTATELLGQSIDAILEEPDRLSAAFVGDDIGVRASQVQVAGRRRDGKSTHFEVSFGRWKADERIFVTTIWRDVTERMIAEAALRESEGRYRALLEAVPQLVWTSSAKGESDYFNPQWRMYTGATVEEHLGWGWLKAVHQFDRGELEATWRSSLASGDIFDIDARLCRANGSYRWFKLRSIPVRAADGKISRWFGTATEITDLIEARETLQISNEELEAVVVERTREREVVLKQLNESQKMESIGQLTGGVAHDFNNLLAVILGSLTLLKKGISDDPRTSRLLEGAIQGAERGATLTKRLLAFARRQDLKLEAIEIQQLIPDLLDFLRQSVGPTISLEIDIPSGLSPVRIDANQFELALMNLAVNARDAMPTGGTLTITFRDEAAFPQSDLPKDLPRGDYVRVSIADTGVGMSEVTLAKAMEPFFTTKGVGKGTGLGLSMVHGLTAQSGGAMQISSQVGKGTVVSLWLPQARREEVRRVREQASKPSLENTSRGSRILLVDDDSLVSMNTAYMLMDLGHSVLELESGTHALRLMETDAQFDVVITDYAMPVMTGLDLASKIKQIHPDMPIIIATGYADLPPQVMLGFLRLNKPYTQEQLAQALEAVSHKKSGVVIETTGEAKR
jgi:PAS domain S-box-containing protein